MRLFASLTLAAAVAGLLPAAGHAAADTPAGASCPALLQHSFPRLQDEQPQSLCQYSGKVILVVNTASYCGFTGQYKALEEVYARFRERGLVVLGFPSNDFAQESGSNRQIAEFCENTFGVKFPMFSKSRVAGAQASPFYRQLALQAGQAPGWNFHKYLLGRDGRVVESFASRIAPDSRSVIRAIEQELAKPAPARTP